MYAKLINNNLFYWCEGCGHCHHVPVDGSRGWQFSGTIENPSLSPSVRHFYTDPETSAQITVCHYWLKNGNIEYCGDCQHKFANTTRQLISIPEDYGLPQEKV